MMDISTLIQSRRTIKPSDMDAGRDIEREVLEEILEDAHFAPTHRLHQPWRFHIFVGEGRTRLSVALGDIYKDVVPLDRQSESKGVKLREKSLQAAACVAVLAKVVNNALPEWEEVAATACAVQNLMLSAHAKGIASSWSSAATLCSQKFVHWLGEDSTFQSLGMIYLGYPVRSLKIPKRHALDDHVTFYLD